MEYDGKHIQWKFQDPKREVLYYMLFICHILREKIPEI